MTKIFEKLGNPTEVKKEYSDLLWKTSERFLTEIRAASKDEAGEFDPIASRKFLDDHTASGNIWLLKKANKLLELEFIITQDQEQADEILRLLRQIENRILELKTMYLKQKRTKKLQKIYFQNKTEE